MSAGTGRGGFPHPAVFDTMEDLMDAVVRLLAAQWSSGEAGQPPQAVLLSGGGTPLPAYERLAREPVRAPISHRAFLSDERMVPIGAPQSNFGRLRPMLEACGFSGGRAPRVQTDLEAHEAAARYAGELTALFDEGGRIALGLLGLGSDGHTCGLFTPGDLARGAGRWAIAVERPDGLAGVTVTPDLLARIGRIVFVVAGGDKRDVVQTLCRRPATIPAGQAVARCPLVEIWLDRAAYPPDAVQTAGKPLP